ncbi:conserved hypothetical protein [Leishmania infantum JPCM5]|uniref:Uncharacterized protein n=2 Tax=Leishmania infantum TaxID=5671 RepID=A4IDQ7_LEIIN|nr:conserved hypothetical protein [Leishmania infantum JPCM5]CAC9552139.1 hypothetical_protein_-_conserved [Leishmania infantum]CAM72990.1 conserved hypothetical protein [Leishmania infantum JPCM5]SUZ46882.1 hypothetical_protein_-_conserved [Leishmania infantum]|eukprot:XP_001469876.1 conserved hypothetical protein [Leishmania infantum JPCM5]
MFSESDESTYTVHEVHRDDRGAVPKPVESQTEPETSSHLARYYRLGTKERHAFDEHMRHLRQQVAAVERERQFRVSHPFQPKTCTPFATVADAVTDAAQADSPSRLAPPVASGIGSSSSPSGVRPVFERLAAQAVQLEMRRRHREEQRRRAEAASLRGAFQPHINHTAPIYAERLQHLDLVPVEERLLHYGEFVARERQRKQELKEVEQTVAWQSTQASVVGAGTSQPRGPEERRQQQEEFLARNHRFLAERSKHRQCAEAAAAEAFSFQPKISATSAALDEARQRCANAVSTSELGQLLNRSVDAPPLSISKTSANAGRRSDALYALAVARQRQRMEKLDHNSSNSGETTNGVDKGKAVEGPKATHQPLTNPTSAKWIAEGAHGPFFQEDFVRRQALYEEVKREEAALRATAVQEPELSSGRPAAHKVDAKQLNQRLYYSAKTAREASERRRQALVSARECPFRPQLSPGTKYVLQHMPSRDGDVVKRLTSQRGSGSSGGARVAMDNDLYAPAPAHQPSLQGHSRSPSQQRKTEVKNSTEVGQDTRRRRTSLRTASPRTEARGERADGSGDELPAQQQQRKQHGRPLTLDQVEHFYQRQIAALQQRKDLIQERREGKAMEELVECTFRPRTNTDRHVGMESGAGEGADTAVSVNHVTGVSAFLERQAVARVRKAEHDELVRTVGLPRHKSAGSNGTSSRTTALSPFKFQTEMRRQRLPSSPLESKQRREAAPFSTAALTTAERALHEAIEQSRRCPGASSQAPLFPLPGCAHASEDGAHFDDRGHVAAASKDVEEPTSRVPPSTLSTEKKGRGDAAAVGVGYDRPSLFSLISPNTFSGRSLGSAAYESGNGKGTPAGRDFASDKPSPSALKGSKQRLTASVKRQRRNRSVSFVEEAADTPVAGVALRGRKSFADPAHLAFLSGEL